MRKKTDADKIYLGRDLAYIPRWWQPRWRGVYADPTKHTVCFGESRSGKSSISGAWVSWLAPRIKDGTYRLWVGDLKGGVEANMIPDSLRSETATNGEELEQLLDDLLAEVERRQRAMIQMHVRKLTPSVGFPSIVLYLDEANDLVRQDNAKALSRKLLRLLSASAAEGVFVLALAQSATKEDFPARSLFQQRIALRLEEGQALLALGNQAKTWGARPWLIPPGCPGEGYVLDYENHEAKHFQAAEVTDADLASLA